MNETITTERRPRTSTRAINTYVAKLRMAELSLSPAIISRASVASGSFPISTRTIYRMLSGQPVSREKREVLARHLNLSLAELEGSQDVPFFRSYPTHAPSSAHDLPPRGFSSPIDSFMQRHGHQSANEVIDRYVLKLFGAQNPDGGWGSEVGVASSPLNTAEVLLALRQHGHSDPDSVCRGLKFLRDSQSSSGGWQCRRQIPGESITVKATALCLQALQACEASGSYLIQGEVPAAFSWLLSVVESGLWPNTPGARPSIPATAFALHAFALAFESRSPRERSVLSETVHRLACIQSRDGGFPFTPGQASSVAASLQVMYSLLLLPQELLAHDSAILPRIRSFFARITLDSLVQTELQENDCIDGRGLQFEHFNAALLLLVSQHRRLFPEAVLRRSLDHIASMMRPDGCPATPFGRIYTWSTAHCVRALLATIPG